MHVEFVACYKATCEALWLRNFISGLQVLNSISKSVKILCDNSFAVFFSKNNKISGKSKHIDIKYLVVRERIQNKEESVENISTQLMVVDPLTKGLSPKLFKECVSSMRIIKSFDVVG